jgi:CO dehydrogenase maturation factor
VKYMDDIITSAVKIHRVIAAASKEKAGNIIVSTGRGGTGKSTFAALASRYLEPPLLLLDIDPDQSLADMLGIDLDSTRITTEIGREVEIKSISDITSDIEDEDAFTELGGSPPFVKIPLLLEWYTQYTSERFDLISLGPRWTMGDYRAANFLFEFIIPSIGKNYANIVVDSPAGLEHLNRKVTPNIDDLFIVLDPSQKSIKHVQRVRKITQEVGINYKHLYLVGNYEFDDKAEQRLESTGEAYLGRLEYDASVKDFNLKGESLLELPDSSPACLSVRRILTEAGYKVG